MQRRQGQGLIEQGRQKCVETMDGKEQAPGKLKLKQVERGVILTADGNE